MTTIFYHEYPGLVVLVCGHKTPMDSEWTEWAKCCHHAMQERGVRKMLVVSKGGGPNARQRGQIVEAVDQTSSEIATAVCTSSIFARGITTALSWLTKARWGSFNELQQRDALDFLDVPANLRPQVLAEVAADWTKLP